MGKREGEGGWRGGGREEGPAEEGKGERGVVSSGILSTGTFISLISKVVPVCDFFSPSRRRQDADGGGGNGVFCDGRRYWVCAEVKRPSGFVHSRRLLPLLVRPLIVLLV